MLCNSIYIYIYICCKALILLFILISLLRILFFFLIKISKHKNVIGFNAYIIQQHSNIKIHEMNKYIFREFYISDVLTKL